MRKLIKNSLWFSHSRLMSYNTIQRRALSDYVQSLHPEIHKIYDSLLEQSIENSVNCNFISQVVEFSAKNSTIMGMKCIDQDTNQYNEITYSQLVDRGYQIGSYFKKRGVNKGEAVALMLGQRPEWWYILVGLMQQGIAVVPCPKLLTSKDLIYRINDLNIRSIVVSQEAESKINIIRDQCPSLKCLLTTGPASKHWDSLSDIFKEKIIPSREITNTKDPCVYLYTSGTTGQPKAVQHNHDYPFFHWPTGRRWLRATPEDLVYNASDTGWGFTLWITCAVWSMGSKLLITPTNKKFNPQKMLTILSEQPVSIFCAAPTLLRLLVAEKNFDDYLFPNLKRIVTVGEALDETVIKRFNSRNIEVSVGFGQAETPLLMGRIDNQPHVPGTMGMPIDPYKIVVLDDKLEPLPPGNIGQIAVDLVKGKKAGIMRGYANAPEKTRNAFSPNGRYYLTGDWAEYRRDGFFAYQGRMDDLMKSRGYRVGPDEIEKVGMSHPAIAKIAVVAVRTKVDSLAQTIKAFILLKPGYNATLELIKSIQNHIKEETAPHKYPRLIECLSLSEWEKYETTSGKVRRAMLRQKEEERLNCHDEPHIALHC